MAGRARVLLLLTLLAALAAQTRAQFRDNTRRELLEKNPALFRLNDHFIANAFDGAQNEVTCTWCVFQVIAAAYQIGNADVKRQISDTLSSQMPGQLSKTLLDQTEQRPTLKGMLTAYYQNDTVRPARGGFLKGPRGLAVNFRQPNTRQLINEQVKRATDGLIPQLFESLPASTKLVFASTLVFSNKWKSELNTVSGKFSLLTGEKVSVDMTFREEELAVLDGTAPDGVMGVAMPYRDGYDRQDIDLLNPRRTGIELYCFIMKDENSGDIRHHLYEEHFRRLAHRQPQQVQVRLPKFDVSSKRTSYVDLVEKLGMSAMFKGGLGPGGQLKVDQLVHKALIQTDEHGTRAVGAAGLGFVPLSLPAQGVRITFDRPFICSLVDTELGQPLFTAFIADPRENTTPARRPGPGLGRRPGLGLARRPGLGRQ